MGLASFPGGIHPPENKALTEKKSLENISIPHVCRIPMQQHIGKPAIPVVQKDDFIKEGQLIGRADGFISANVHSSIPGKVTAVENHHTPFSPHGLCVVIEVEGSFTPHSAIKTNSWEKLAEKELINKIAASGIVGMGGAAFPTHVKLSPPADKKIDTLIINAAECEPYLTVDDNLTQKYAAEIIEGVRIVLKCLKIKKAIIGLEKNTPAAVKKLRAAISKNNPKEEILIQAVKTKYPQGSEKQLIQALTGRKVPTGALPMDVHVVVQNVGTIFAIYEAIIKNKPLYERYITLSGEMVKNPGNYKVRLGTLISDIIEECGGLKDTPSKIIMGGPMCGLALSSTEVPVVKGTSGILFLSEKETSINKYQACIRCGRCISVCPVNLLPCDLGNAVENSRYDIAEELSPFDCIMCGSCAYICPAKRPLNHFIKLAQQKIRNRALKKS